MGLSEKPANRMKTKSHKSIAVAVDGSSNSQRALDYIRIMFGPQLDLQLAIVYVMPSLPQLLVDACDKDPSLENKLNSVRSANRQVGDRILTEASARLIDNGFKPEQIETNQLERKTDIARDIALWTRECKADALLVGNHGRSSLKDYFIGNISRKILELSRDCPIWVSKGMIGSKNVLIAFDGSENAFRAVEYAAHMLHGTKKQVTLFHIKRSLSCILPWEVITEVEEVDEYWLACSEEEIKPKLNRARNMLRKAGFSSLQIVTRIEESSRRPARGIINAAQRDDCGTIVMGRHGRSDAEDFTMGDIARKVLEKAENTVLWIVN